VTTVKPSRTLSLAERITRPGPKRLLALDGGGIRGLISIELLAEIEVKLRERLAAGPEFVLADYFDYIGGTSTGGIIAALLALGLPVARVRKFYVDQGREMFRRPFAPWRWFRSLYRESNLSAVLRETFGRETTLGSDRLRTLLLLVMRNADTDSPWPLSNNPAAKYNDRAMEHCNLDLPLWKLVRASTAAPVYFPPQTLRLGKASYQFVDGGMTSYNNPAFLLFLMATLPPYKLCWQTGEQHLLLVSVGTGATPRPGAARNVMTAIWSVLMDPRYAALVEQDFLCRVFGRCIVGGPIDKEIGDLKEMACGFPKLFTYARYNAELSREGLDELGLSELQPRKVRRMDSVKYIHDLMRLGREVARRDVSADHFEGFV
jgi:predicted acylesterase/phospholipase RssA